MKRADAERSHLHPLNGLRTERLLESRPLRSVDQAPGEQQEHACSGEPSERERERARRRGIEPLKIVDRDENGPVVGEQLQRAPSRDPECARIHRICGRLFEEKRHLERAPPGRRQRGQDVVEDVLEEIAEPDVGEAALGLGRSRREDAQSTRARMLDAGQPERRLPDPRIALQHECGRPFPHVVDEGVKGGELLLPADDLEHHRSHATIVTEAARNAT